MDQNIRETLEAPFPDEEIRTRKGTFGKELAYAGVHSYIARLNLAFAGDWSFDITEHVIQDNEVVVLGKLTAGGATKSAFGCSTITTARDSGERVSVGDDLKSAASDALKKCCTLLGLGLHLYGMDVHTPEKPEKNSTVPFPTKAGNNGNTLTSRQYGAIVALAEKAGYSESQVKTRVLDRYSLPLEKLDRRTASELISELNKKVNGNGKAVGGTA
jgi:hypothetical protein